MLRTAFSRASASRHVSAVIQPSESKQESPKHISIDMLANTSFSPMNPDVTYLKVPNCTGDTSRSAPNIAALIATSTSCSPANPGATLPLMSGVLDMGSHPLGSRSRLLEDIPSIMKRFDVPKANVLTRFPDAPHPPSPSKRPEPSQDPATYQPVKTPQTKPLVENTEKAPENKAVVKAETETTAVVAVPRPWLFKLPGFLRPRVGTTYYSTLAMGQEMKAAGNPNIIQYILYGNPDPGAKVKAAVAIVEKRTLLQSVLYGVPDEDGEKMVKIAMNTETVAEVKVVGDQKEVVAVKKAEKNKMVEVHDDVGYGMMAK